MIVLKVLDAPEVVLNVAYEIVDVSMVVHAVVVVATVAFEFVEVPADVLEVLLWVVDGSKLV